MGGEEEEEEEVGMTAAEADVARGTATASRKEVSTGVRRGVIAEFSTVVLLEAGDTVRELDEGLSCCCWKGGEKSNRSSLATRKFGNKEEEGKEKEKEKQKVKDMKPYVRRGALNTRVFADHPAWALK